VSSTACMSYEAQLIHSVRAMTSFAWAFWEELVQIATMA